MAAATLATLLVMCQNFLGTTTIFSTTILTDWINRAIEDLSIYFPLHTEYPVSTTLNTHYYDLETYIKGILSVQYDTSLATPKFLKRKSITDPDFWYSDDYYDFIKQYASTSTLPAQLVISIAPPASKTINLWVTGDHAALASAGDECTVMERHINLILLHVRWKAFQQLSALESEDPSPLNTRASSFELNAERAGLAYHQALEAAASAEAESGQTPWKMDDLDRIY